MPQIPANFGSIQPQTTVLESYLKIRAANEQYKVQQADLQLQQQQEADRQRELQQQGAYQQGELANTAEKNATEAAKQRDASVKDRTKVVADAIRNDQWGVVQNNMDVLQHYGFTPQDMGLDPNQAQDPQHLKDVMNKVADTLDPPKPVRPQGDIKTRPGDTIVDPSGKPIYTNTNTSPSAAGQPSQLQKKVDYLANLNGLGPNDMTGRKKIADELLAGKDSVFKQKIDDFNKMFGPGHEDDALKAATNKVSVKVQDGIARLTDNSTGTVTEITVGANKDAPVDKSAVSPKDKGLWGLVDKATGLGSGVVNALSPGASWIGLYPKGDVQYARQRFEAAQNDMLQAFANTPRLGATLMQMIQKQVEIEPKMWDDPMLLGDRMVAIRDQMNQRLDYYNSLKNDPTQDPKERNAAKTGASAVKHFLKVMKVPDDVQRDPQTGVVGKMKADAPTSGPTATDKNGNKVMWDGKAWIPQQ